MESVLRRWFSVYLVQSSVAIDQNQTLHVRARAFHFLRILRDKDATHYAFFKRNFFDRGEKHVQKKHMPV